MVKAGPTACESRIYQKTADGIAQARATRLLIAIALARKDRTTAPLLGTKLRFMEIVPLEMKAMLGAMK